jgi:hypothetical protein
MHGQKRACASILESKMVNTHSDVMHARLHAMFWTIDIRANAIFLCDLPHLRSKMAVFVPKKHTPWHDLDILKPVCKLWQHHHQQHEYIANHTRTHIHAHAQVCSFLKDDLLLETLRHTLKARRKKVEYAQPALSCLSWLLGTTQDQNMKRRALMALASADVRT